MTTRTMTLRPVYATVRPFEIIDSQFVKLCARCGIHYETKTNRPPVTKLCTDCKDVLPIEERRMYKTGN